MTDRSNYTKADEETIQREIELDAMKAVIRQQTLDAFDLKPWQIGLTPVPWRIRIWRKATFGRWRVRRMLARERSE